MPVWHGTVEWLKGQDIEFAFDYIEQLLAVCVDVGPTSKPGPITTSNADVSAG
jgi:hypothetical protein